MGPDGMKEGETEVANPSFLLSGSQLQQSKLFCPVTEFQPRWTDTSETPGPNKHLFPQVVYVKYVSQ